MGYDLSNALIHIGKPQNTAISIEGNDNDHKDDDDNNDKWWRQL